MLMARFCEVCSILVVLVVAGGCGGEPRAAVTGKITSAGKPVVAGLINFQRPGAPPLGGAINADGTYEFSLPPGEYQVRIDAPGVMPPWKEGDPEPKPVPRLAPAKYADFVSSGLTLSVTDGSSKQQDFQLD